MNIEWKDAVAGARKTIGGGFIKAVTVPDSLWPLSKSPTITFYEYQSGGRVANIYWSGTDAAEAQRTLESLVALRTNRDNNN